MLLSIFSYLRKCELSRQCSTWLYTVFGVVIINIPNALRPKAYKLSQSFNKYIMFFDLDMFPYTSSLRNASAKNAYSKSEIKELLHAAASLALSVMPLVQTFGHLEFALKLQEFEHLREVPDSPQSLCPSLNNSLIFIEEMIAQVIDLHQTSTLSTDPNIELIEDDDLLTPNFTHLHIGL